MRRFYIMRESFSLSGGRRESEFIADNLIMDVQNLSMNISQNRVQEEAAVKVQAMLVQTIKDASADLVRLMDSGKIINDPARGNFLNVLM